MAMRTWHTCLADKWTLVLYSLWIFLFSVFLIRNSINNLFTSTLLEMFYLYDDVDYILLACNERLLSIVWMRKTWKHKERPSRKGERRVISVMIKIINDDALRR